MSPVFLIFLNLLTAMLPVLERALPSEIDAVLSQIASAIPLLEGAAPTVVAAVQAIINALSNNPNKTADQLATLQTLAAQAAASWNASVSAAQAEDAASTAAP